MAKSSDLFFACTDFIGKPETVLTCSLRKGDRTRKALNFAGKKF